MFSQMLDVILCITVRGLRIVTCDRVEDAASFDTKTPLETRIARPAAENRRLALLQEPTFL